MAAGYQDQLQSHHKPAGEGVFLLGDVDVPYVRWEYPNTHRPNLGHGVTGKSDFDHIHWVMVEVPGLHPPGMAQILFPFLH